MLKKQSVQPDVRINSAEATPLGRGIRPNDPARFAVRMLHPTLMKPFFVCVFSPISSDVQSP